MSGFEPFLFGAAASGGAAATGGVLGSAGAFSVGTALSSIGTAVGTLGALQSSRADATASDMNAASARAEAASKENAQRIAAQRQLGSIRANISKSGATMAGTPLMVLAESAANAEIDALNTQYNGQRESALYSSRASNTRRAGSIRAGASLLSSASKIF